MSGASLSKVPATRLGQGRKEALLLAKDWAMSRKWPDKARGPESVSVYDQFHLAVIFLNCGVNCPPQLSSHRHTDFPRIKSTM
jgi:hypothetical protein